MRCWTTLSGRVVGPDRPLSGLAWLALVISAVGSPFLTPLYTVVSIVSASVEARGQLLLWGLIVSIFLIGIALSYVAVQVWRGQITDFHVSQQSQRHVPFMVAVCSSLVGTVVLWWMEAPWMLVALGMSFAMQGIFFGLLTRYRKISMHVAVLASCITALIMVFGWMAVPLIGFLPLQGWARIYRRRHSLGQVVAAGVLAPTLTLLIMLAWWLIGEGG